VFEGFLFCLFYCFNVVDMYEHFYFYLGCALLADNQHFVSISMINKEYI
jgi:hypothetical protein